MLRHVLHATDEFSINSCTPDRMNGVQVGVGGEWVLFDRMREREEELEIEHSNH